MVLTGTLINGLLIVIGTLIGLLFTGISENIKKILMKVIGIFIVVIGINMTIEIKEYLIVLVSLILGVFIGEKLNIDGFFCKFGEFVNKKLKNSKSNLSQSFITASLLYIVGAMSILGALDSGLRNDHTLLYTKGIIDGITSIVLASTIGVGVALSAVPLIIYQGLIAIFASQITDWVPSVLMNNIIDIIVSTGGIMLIGMGFNFLKIIELKTANLLPSLFLSPIFVIITYWLK